LIHACYTWTTAALRLRIDTTSLGVDSCRPLGCASINTTTACMFETSCMSGTLDSAVRHLRRAPTLHTLNQTSVCLRHTYFCGTNPDRTPYSSSTPALRCLVAAQSRSPRSLDRHHWSKTNSSTGGCVLCRCSTYAASDQWIMVLDYHLLHEP
jgi:hypothetical protein